MPFQASSLAMVQSTAMRSTSPGFCIRPQPPVGTGWDDRPRAWGARGSLRQSHALRRRGDGFAELLGGHGNGG